jgi:2-haloacid dehalogenase
VRNKYEFFSWFDDLFISGELRLAKPDPRIFHFLLERIDRLAGECLLIDDSTRNIAAAQSLGFQTILFLNPQQLEKRLLEMGLLHA